MKINSVKWKLMLTTLPITLAIIALKFGIVYGLHYDGLVKFSEIGIVVTGGIFLVGFMLAGTIADYKESEKIPGELACTLEAIEDAIVLGHQLRSEYDLPGTIRQLHNVTEAIICWFEHKVTEDEVFKKISDISKIALVMEKGGVGQVTSRVEAEQSNLRKLFTRAHVIEKTSFLAPGYALLEVLTFVIIGLMLVSKFENETTGIIIISFLSQIFIYMIRLIRDEDDPFEYSSTGRAKEADIDLHPLLQYELRSRQHLDSLSTV